MNQLTKREQIAVAAMQALISKEGAPRFPAHSRLVAQASTEYADALMEALQVEAFNSAVEEEDTHGE
jgi:hypothetical protein